MSARVQSQTSGCWIWGRGGTGAVESGRDGWKKRVVSTGQRVEERKKEGVGGEGAKGEERCRDVRRRWAGGGQASDRLTSRRVPGSRALGGGAGGRGARRATHLEYEGGDPDPGGLGRVVAALGGRLVWGRAGELVEDGVEEDEGRADDGHRRQTERGDAGLGGRGGWMLYGGCAGSEKSRKCPRESRPSRSTPVRRVGSRGQRTQTEELVPIRGWPPAVRASALRSATAPDREARLPLHDRR